MSSAVQRDYFTEFYQCNAPLNKGWEKSDVVEKLRSLWDSINGQPSTKALITWHVAKEVSALRHDHVFYRKSFRYSLKNTIQITDSFYDRLFQLFWAPKTFGHLFKHMPCDRFSTELKLWKQNPDSFFTTLETSERLICHSPHIIALMFRISSLKSIDDTKREDYIEAIAEEVETRPHLNGPSFIRFCHACLDIEGFTIEEFFYVIGIEGKDQQFLVDNGLIKDYHKAFQNAGHDPSALMKILPNLYLSHDDPSGLERAVQILLGYQPTNNTDATFCMQRLFDLARLKAVPPRNIAAYPTAPCYKPFLQDLVESIEITNQMRSIEKSLKQAVETGTTYQSFKTLATLADRLADQGNVGDKAEQ